MTLSIEMKEKIFLTIKTYFKLNKMERNEMIYFREDQVCP